MFGILVEEGIFLILVIIGGMGMVLILGLILVFGILMVSSNWGILLFIFLMVGFCNILFEWLIIIISFFEEGVLFYV